jgi:hypothetical protein
MFISSELKMLYRGNFRIFFSTKDRFGKKSAGALELFAEGQTTTRDLLRSIRKQTAEYTIFDWFSFGERP